MSLDPDAARKAVLGDYGELLATTLDCADAVAEGFETTVDGCPATRDSRGIRDPLRATLQKAGVLSAYPTVLIDAVTAAGGEMDASPVAAPPYVTVTSTGLVLRATLGDRRLVVRVAAFSVVDDAFVRTAGSPADALEVTIEP